MGWGHKIDVVAADVLEMQHDRGQLLRVNSLTVTFMADIVILAEVTHQIAVGEKDRPRPFSTHQRCFFAEMRIVA